MSEFQKDELSLEETNRLRAQLGLNPLLPDSDDEGGKESNAKVADDDGDDSDPLRNQEEKAARNYAEHQEAVRKKREEDSVAERIAKARNRRDLNRRLQGPTLGEAGPSDAQSIDNAHDTKKWLKAQQKKAKDLAARRQQEEAEAEAAALADLPTYGSKDLRGLRVGHDIDDFALEEGGEGRILTLRDSKILDDDEDELMDTALDEAERDKRNEERKKGPKKYTGLDDAEFVNTRPGEKRSILSKYDQDIDAADHHRDADVGFTLGGETLSKNERQDEARRENERKLSRPLLDLDYTKNEAISDYLQEGDIGFKKPKSGKKKKGHTASRIKLDDDNDVEMKQTVEGSVESPTVHAGSSRTSKPSDDASDLVDDEDLARSLAFTRRKQARRTYQKMTPEMIAQNLAAQRAAEEAEQSTKIANQRITEQDVEGQDSKTNGTGMVFDETSEFVRNIQTAKENINSSSRTSSRNVPLVKQEREIENGEIGAGIDADTLVKVKQEESEQEDDDEVMNEFADEEGDVEAGPDGLNVAEPLVSGGLASTLSLLRNQGLVQQLTPEQRERELQQRKYDLWLSQRRTEDSVREAELALSKAQGSAKDQAQREYDNRVREMEDAKLAQARFKDYRPDVEIKYHDEFGRELNNHEAWKRLSHVFHGKAPGKKKQEKRLQRIEDEKRREKMLSGDTPTGMSKAFSERAERSGQAHLVIGVGARNNAPQDAPLLQPSMNKVTLEKGKSKSNGVDLSSRSDRYDAAPAVGGDARSDLHSNANGGVTSMIPRSTLPKTKANFMPVKRTNASALAGHHPNGGVQSPASNTTSSMQPSKFKLAFGKRPAPSTPDTSSKQRRLEE